MKKSELKKQIEEVITEILGEGEAEERAAKEAEKKSIDAQIKALTMKKAEINKSGVVAETEDEEFDAPEKEPSKAELKKLEKKLEKELEKELGSKNKKKDEIISAYKKIAGDIKEKAKAANSGNKEAKAWIDKHQDIIKAYRKLQKAN